MPKADEPVRRRRRAPRERIAEGEFRNVTFRAGSKVYNMLVDASNESGYSISDFAERIIEQSLKHQVHKEKDSLYDLVSGSHEILNSIALMLKTYEAKEGEDWMSHAPSRVAAHFAIQAIADRGLPIPKDFYRTSEENPLFGQTELQSAARLGLQLGSILFAPSDARGYDEYGRDIRPQSIRKDNSEK